MNKHKKMIRPISLCLYFGIISCGNLTASDSNEGVPVPIATSATVLSENDLHFLRQDEFMIQVSTRNANGYMEHFIAGKLDDIDSRRVAFYQGYEFLPDRSRGYVFRQLYQPAPGWDEVYEWIKSTTVVLSSIKKAEDEKVARTHAGRLTISFILRYKGVTVKESFENPYGPQSEMIDQCIWELQRTFGFRFKMLALDYLDGKEVKER